MLVVEAKSILTEEFEAAMVAAYSIGSERRILLEVSSTDLGKFYQT